MTKRKRVWSVFLCITGLLLTGGIVFTFHGVQRQSYRTQMITVQRELPVNPRGSLQQLHAALLEGFPEYTTGMQLVKVIGVVDCEGEFSSAELTYWRLINDSYEGGLVEHYEFLVDWKHRVVESVFYFRGAGRASSALGVPVESTLLHQTARDIVDSAGFAPVEDDSLRVDIWSSAARYYQSTEDGGWIIIDREDEK